MKRNRINRYITLSPDAAGKLATIVAAWRPANPGIDAVGVVERLIAEEFGQIDADIEAAGQWAAGGATLDDPSGVQQPPDDPATA